jgi:hypothetical protein
MPVIIDGSAGITTPGETNTGNLSVAGTTTLTTPLPVASGGTGATSLSGITTGTSTNLAGGSNGTIPYQSASGTTQMLAVGTAGQVLQTNGAGAPTWTTISAGFTLGTPVATTSGTSINFTGIPAGTKQIVISFVDVSASGGNNFLIQIGDSGGIESASYTSLVMKLTDGSVPEASQATSGFILTRNVSSGQALRGVVTLQLENSSNNTFMCSGILVPAGNILYSLAGYKSLSGVLDRVRLTTDGADTFDAGEINIAYI